MGSTETAMRKTQYSTTPTKQGFFLHKRKSDKTDSRKQKKKDKFVLIGMGHQKIY